MENPVFRLDRSQFKMQSFHEADMQLGYWKTQAPEKRLQAAFYLNSVAFQFDMTNPPRLDRTQFSIRRHDS